MKIEKQNEREKYITPIEELELWIPNHSGLLIHQLEDHFEELQAFGDITPEQSEYLIDWLVQKRVIDWKNNQQKPEIHMRVFMCIMEKEGIRVRYNIMTGREEIICSKWKHNEVLGLAEEQRIYKVQETVSKYKFPENKVLKYIKLSAVPYHPALDWIKSNKWDGVDRFKDLFEAIDSKNANETLAKTYLYKWCLQSVRAIIGQTGFCSENVLVFKGEQGAGKTRFVVSLAPNNFIKTGLQISPNNKDSVLEGTSAWIVEIGELDATTRKNDHAQLKAFLSKSADYIRKPYAVAEEMIPRKTSFCATVNTDSFLVDDTGNRRYWVIEVGDVNAKHGIDMQQFWRQIYETAILDVEEHPHWLEKEEKKMQKIESEKYRELHPICQKILKLSFTEEKYLTQELASLVGVENPTNHECKVIKQFMLNDMGFVQQKCGGNRYYLMNPNPVNDNLYDLF